MTLRPGAAFFHKLTREGWQPLAYDGERRALQVGLASLVLPQSTGLQALDSCVRRLPDSPQERLFTAALVRSPEGEIKSLPSMTHYLRHLSYGDREDLLERAQYLMMGLQTGPSPGSNIAVLDGVVEKIYLSDGSSVSQIATDDPHEDVVAYRSGISGSPENRLVPVVGLAFIAAQAVQTESFR